MICFACPNPTSIGKVHTGDVTNSKHWQPMVVIPPRRQIRTIVDCSSPPVFDVPGDECSNHNQTLLCGLLVAITRIIMQLFAGRGNGNRG